MSPADPEPELEADPDVQAGVVAAALDALAVRHDMSLGQRQQLARMLSLLQADVHAPTAVRAPADAVDVHLADSLVALDLDAVRSATTIADLGSGAGYPGLPLAVALPAASVRLIESSSRKCAFLRRAALAAGTDNATIVCRRVEEWAEGVGGHDLVTARALAPAATVVEYAAPLLHVGGMFVDWRGRRDPEHEDAAARAADLVGLARVEVRSVTPFGGARNHYLHLYLKVRSTPERFPRRAGVARKRPLVRSPGG
jgi:16S rRNA (guanine527-N7)-methyltransferase